jgi:hypothetical protein
MFILYLSRSECWSAAVKAARQVLEWFQFAHPHVQVAIHL